MTSEQENIIVEEIKDRFLWQYSYPYDASPLFTGVFNGKPLPEVVAGLFPELQSAEITGVIQYAISDVRG